MFKFRTKTDNLFTFIVFTHLYKQNGVILVNVSFMKHESVTLIYVIN